MLGVTDITALHTEAMNTPKSRQIVRTDAGDEKQVRGVNI